RPAARRDPALRVAADLPVGDEHADDADRDERPDPEQPEAPVGGVATAEARERQRAEDPAGEPAEVPADRDVPPREGEDEVDDDDRERAAAEDVVALPLEHEAGAEDSEDRPGRAERDLRRVQQKGPGRAGEPRDDVEQQVAPPAERRLDRAAPPPEREHV